MKPLEWILLRFCQREEEGPAAEVGFDPPLVSQRIERDFPGLLARIEGKRIVDFGCGEGYQAVTFALQGAEHVLALDIDHASLGTARRTAVSHDVDDRIRFATEARTQDHGSYDFVISINSMEHFSDPEAVLASMISLLKPGGCLLVSFDPTWYSPWGAHMHFFTRIPWVHLLFPESTVMKVRSRYRDDGAARYEEVRGGLNRMSIARFERLMSTAGVATTSIDRIGVKGIRAFARIPVLRELLVPKIVSQSIRIERTDIPAARNRGLGAREAKG